ncbi:MAG: pyridoxamine 5'-phosphate oxidase [Chloroflexi bacterium]|nr:MAG: pyridoxamine 5'-phosphate oxidase [Chloroflexota bacterium]
MTSWGQFAEAAPELAAFGEERFRAAEVAYLATVRADGSPRVHPFTPILSDGRLFAFMEPTSPKGHDLRRDPRYSIHSLVTDQQGSDGEFLVSGRATMVDDAKVRTTTAEAAPYDPAERYVLFELSVEEAAATVYEGLEPVRRRWRRAQG